MLTKEYQATETIRSTHLYHPQDGRRSNQSSLAHITPFRSVDALQRLSNTSNYGYALKGNCSADDATSKSETRADIPVWPPDGLNHQSRLTPDDAELLICAGALSFEGYISQALHISTEHKRYYAFAGTAQRDDDSGPLFPFSRLSNGFSLVLENQSDNNTPWETLEQPSMALCFGDLPGTITLSRHVSSLGRSLESEPPGISVNRRDMSLQNVLQNLEWLQYGVQEDVSRSKLLVYTLD